MASTQISKTLKAVNAVGSVLARAGIRASLDLDDLHRTAAKQHGLDDFGPDTYLVHLKAFITSLENDADLSTIGRITARQNILSHLGHRLQLFDWRKKHPEVVDEQITQPVFVLGLPRTGTTVLFGMLAENPAFRSPASWEVQHPVPPPRPEEREGDPRIAQMDEMYDGLRRIAPGVDAIHPVGATLPQECIAIHSVELCSYQFRVTYPVHSYFEHLRSEGLADAYATERLMLQHLQSRDRREHWLLKSPAHLMWLDNLLDVFPDALIVQTHRDPAKILPSVSSLYETFWSGVSRRVDPHAIGRSQMDEWTWGMEQAMAARARVPDERVVDVHFEDTINDPVGVMRQIYDKFGFEVTDAAREGVHRYLAENDRHKHGVHSYDLAHFGLDRDEVHEQFAHYMERFDVRKDV